MDEAFQLSHEALVGARDPADRRLAQQREILRAAPVDQECLYGRAVIKPGGDILVADRVRRQGALDIHRVDGKPQRVARLAGGKPGLRREQRPGDGQRPVVVGETVHRTVAARQPPAMAERRHLAPEMGKQRLGIVCHSRTSTSGIDGICPALKLARLIDSCSASKRTGTSNS